MKIYSVFDKEFALYGRVINDDFSDILDALKDTECPNNVVYTPSYPSLEKTESFKKFENIYYGGMPIQIGYCNGHNNTLNCLEYHMDSEINLSNEEFVLLLGLRSQIVNNHFDTSLVKAFRVPANVAVEVFATSLHYAPCREDNKGFRVIIVLPKGTNCGDNRNEKEPLLYSVNKWLLAHKDAPQVNNGAFIGLDGENIKI